MRTSRMLSFGTFVDIYAHVQRGLLSIGTGEVFSSRGMIDVYKFRCWKSSVF